MVGNFAAKGRDSCKQTAGNGRELFCKRWSGILRQKAGIPANKRPGMAGNFAAKIRKFYRDFAKFREWVRSWPILADHFRFRRWRTAGKSLALLPAIFPCEAGLESLNPNSASRWPGTAGTGRELCRKNSKNFTGISRMGSAVADPG